VETGNQGQAPVTAPETTFAATPAQAVEPAQTSAPDNGRTEPANATADGTTAKSADPGTEIDLGVDINSLPEEARAYALKAERDMKAAFTRKAQELAANRNKVDEYDRFMADPVASLQRLAAQYGFHISPAQAAHALGQPPTQPEEWQPNDWNEVLERAAQKGKDQALAEFQTKFKPFLDTVQQQQQKNIEAQLTSIDPEWKNYEGEMVALLKEHPTLARNVEKLYRLAVPPEVIEARATKAAIERMQKNASAARVSSVSTTKSTPAQQEAKTFAEAVEMAKAQLSNQSRR
jgi:hypothetical protein